jgi:hypothetical protein
MEPRFPPFTRIFFLECATDFKKEEAVVREEIPRVEVGSD